MPDKNAKPKKVIAVSAQKLQKAAEFILQVSRKAELQTLLAIGLYLLRKLFHGSEEAFRSRDPRKPDSLNDLANLPKMKAEGWNRAKLDRAVEIALMAKAHRNLNAWRRLKLSHFVEVIGQPVEKQRELLDRAQLEDWTVDQLREAIGAQKAPRVLKAPGSVTPDKALGRVRKTMKFLADPETEPEPSLLESGVDPAVVAELTAVREKHLGVLERIQEQLEQMKRLAADRLKNVAGKVAAPG